MPFAETVYRGCLQNASRMCMPSGRWKKVRSLPLNMWKMSKRELSRGLLNSIWVHVKLGTMNATICMVVHFFP